MLVVERVPLTARGGRRRTSPRGRGRRRATGLRGLRGSPRSALWANTLLPVTRSTGPVFSNSSSTVSGPNAPVITFRPCSRAISRDVGSDVDPDGAMPRLRQRGDQRAVVAAELDHRLGPQDRRSTRHSRRSAGPDPDRAGGERVVLEQDLRVDWIDDLDQTAVVTHADQQGIALLEGICSSRRNPPARGNSPSRRTAGPGGVAATTDVFRRNAFMFTFRS